MTFLEFVGSIKHYVTIDEMLRVAKEAKYQVDIDLTNIAFITFVNDSVIVEHNTKTGMFYVLLGQNNEYEDYNLLTIEQIIYDNLFKQDLSPLIEVDIRGKMSKIRDIVMGQIRSGLVEGRTIAFELQKPYVRIYILPITCESDFQFLTTLIVDLATQHDCGYTITLL